MKKYLIILCIIVAMTYVTGCKDGDYDIDNKTNGNRVMGTETIVNTTAADDVITTTSNVKIEKQPVEDKDRGVGQIEVAYGAEDAKRLGVDKTLVWVVARGVCPEESVVERFNELLINKYGCDFVVQFSAYADNIYFDDIDYEYYDMVKDMQRLDHQADILYSGNMNEYGSFAREGIYEPLSGYFASEEGQKLYNAYAPEVWKKTERDGEVYGYVSEIYPDAYAAAVCNTELAAKYGIDVQDSEWSFYDVGEYLKAAGVTKDSAHSDEVILACRPEALLLLEGYHNIDEFGYGIFFTKTSGSGGWTAVNIAEEPRFLKLVKTIKEYADMGVYTCLYSGELWQHNPDYVAEQSGKFVFDFTYGYPTGILLTKENFVCADDTICDIKVGQWAYAANEPMNNMINGVASWSEHKEEALKLITLIQTEAELSNLLEYGIEGVDYKYEKREIIPLKAGSGVLLPTLSSGIANMSRLHSVLADPDDKLAYSKEISANYIDAPNMLYDLDMSEYMEKIETISSIYKKYSAIFFKAQSDDVEAVMADFGQELSAAGIDEIIAELNRQMRE